MFHVVSLMPGFRLQIQTLKEKIMSLQSSLRYVALALLIALFAVAGSSASAQRAETTHDAASRWSWDAAL